MCSYKYYCLKKKKAFFLGIVLSIAAVIYGIISFWHGFQKFEASHIRKNGNRVAHLLAKHVSGIED